VHEGGIATPLIAHWPKTIKSQKATLNHSPAYLIDIMPTILDIARAEYPERYKGNDIWPLEGQSMTGLFENGVWSEHEFMFWEHEDNCTCRMGKFKAIQKYDEGVWELYDMQKDRSELNDISKENTDILNIITQKWQEWAESHLVIPKPEKWSY
jgi:arylsulfatase